MNAEGVEIAALRAELQRLDGLEQMRTRIHHCARALDRLDRSLLEAQFWPDAHVDYGVFYRGPVPGFLDVAMRFQGSMRDTQHLIGSVCIELDGDEARSESYVHANHVIVEDEGLTQLRVGGRYLDRFERRGGMWRLTYRTEVIDWGSRFRQADGWFESNDPLPKGQRNRGDLSYEFMKC